MQIFAINGSPRKKWNTATLLENALEGAKKHAKDAQTEIIHLYNLDRFTGCRSCFQCKRIGSSTYGKCPVRDGLKPVLEKVLYADALLFGSPIYFSDMTGMIRCFLERLLFPCFTYDQGYTSLAPKKIPTAFVYTMNVTEKLMAEYHYPERLAPMENFVGHIFGYQAKVLFVNDTFQFPDYGKYKSDAFSAEEKALRRKEHFPLDCERARELGKSLAEMVSAGAGD